MRGSSPRMTSGGAGVKFLGSKLLRGDGGKKADHRGERVISRKAIAQGMSDCLRCPVCSCAQLSTILHTRSRVQRASDIPCALFFLEGGKLLANLGQIVPREREVMLGNGNASATHSLSSPVHAGDPVRRGFSAQILTTSLRGALATKQSMPAQAARWIASLRS